MTSDDITVLLGRWSQGDGEALRRVLPFVYEEMRATARAYMNHERSNHTLQATGLVHETFLRLSETPPSSWKDRKHFFGVAARLMRQVLVDYARQHRAEKRGGGNVIQALRENMTALDRGINTDYLLLDLCLKKLEAVDPRKAEIVELRFFGGLSLEEIAQNHDLAISTVKRELTLAKLWMYRELETEAAGDHSAAGKN